MSQTNGANFRKKIISFKCTWKGLLIFIGIMSLYTIWPMHRAYVKEAKKVFIISQLEQEMLSAKIDFKTKVQKWKNILLRGKTTGIEPNTLQNESMSKFGLNDLISKCARFTNFSFTFCKI